MPACIVIIMNKQKIYLETTLFNYYFDTDRDAHADVVALFEECAAGKHEPYTSDYAVIEIEEASTERCEKMIGLIDQYRITVLPASKEADKLAMTEFPQLYNYELMVTPKAFMISL